MQRNISWRIGFALLLGPAIVWPQTSVPLITFGNQAGLYQGDDDYREVVFLKVPVAEARHLYLRIFDPDCGGALDERHGSWDTRTKLSLLGGKGVYSESGLQQRKLEFKEPAAGELLATKTFGVNRFTDNKWVVFARFRPESGEKIGDYYYLKLVVEGLQGNDGNVFDVAISLDPKQNRPPSGAELLNYAPTVSLPVGSGRFAELRFSIPNGVEALHIRNFDVEYGKIGFETASTSDFTLRTSGQGRWQEDVVPLRAEQTGQPGAVVVATDPKRKNDFILQILDPQENRLPIELPIRLLAANARPRPVARSEFLAECNSVVFDGSRSTDPEHDRLRYHWDFGDGQHATGARVIHGYAEPGRYRFTLTVEDDSGRLANRSSHSDDLLVNQPPNAIAGPDQVAAPGDELRFDAVASNDADGEITRYDWDFGDGSHAQGVQVGHRYQRAGRYAVRLRVKDDSASLCNFAVAETRVWVNAQPVAEAGEDRVAAEQESVVLDAGNSFDSDGELVGYHWDFGDGANAEGVQVEHAYTNPGSYAVTLTVEDSAAVADSRATDTIRVLVNDRPIAVVKGFDRGAVDQVLAYSAGDSYDRDGKLVDYRWDFGDGHQAAGARATHAFAGPGTYTLHLTVKDNSGSRSETGETDFKVVINDPPIAEAGDDQFLTAGKVEFDGRGAHDSDGTIIGWDWDFGDDTNGHGPQPTHVYRSPGTYRVVLTVTDDSETLSHQTQDMMTVTVNTKPVADAGPDRAGTLGLPMRFDGRGSFDQDGHINTWHWDFGDGQQASGPTVSHVYHKAGVYSVLLRVDDDSGHAQANDFARVRAVVNASPVAIAGPDVLAAPGQEITFDGSDSYDPDGRIVAYRWQFSDGKATSNKAKTHRHFAAPGIYTATLTITDDSGVFNAETQATINIKINHRPLAKPNAPRHTCQQLVRFDATGSSDADGDALSYRWNFGDGSPPVLGPKPAHTYRKSGKYPVSLTVNDGTGLANASHSAATQVTINQRPVAVMDNPRVGCAGEIVLFDASKSFDPEGGRLSYRWDLGDGIRTEGMSPNRIFKHGGIYPIMLHVADDSGLACAEDSERGYVEIAEAPVAEAGPDQTVCTNVAVRFDGTRSRDFDGVVNSYHWEFGDIGTDSSGDGANPSHIYRLPGEYRPTLTITGDRIGQCNNKNSDSLIVNVLASPVAAFTTSSVAAPGEPILFDASLSAPSPPQPGSENSGSSHEGLSFSWDFGDGSNGEGLKVRHSYQKPGKYFVILRVANDSQSTCNSATVRHPIVINARPLAIAGPDRDIAPDQVTIFNGGDSSDPDGVVTNYRWEFGDDNAADGVEVQHQYREPGDYVVRLRVSDETQVGNKQAEDTLRVRVNAPPKGMIDLVEPAYCIGDPVVFDGSASMDPDGNIIQWQWSFGDGSRAEGTRVSHSYVRPGHYSATLVVTDDSSTVNRYAETSRVIIVNRPPIAQAGPDQRVCPGESVKFDAGGSADWDGKVADYQWDFGDGHTAEGARAEHAYVESGRYQVRLKVSDDSGSACGSGEDSVNVNVNAAPSAGIRVPDGPLFSGGANDAVLFDATLSTDVDGDPLTYYWNFGDGSSGGGAMVLHQYSKPGRYIVGLRVRDDSGTSCRDGSIEQEIHVLAHEQ